MVFTLYRVWTPWAAGRRRSVGICKSSTRWQDDRIYSARQVLGTPKKFRSVWHWRPRVSDGSIPWKDSAKRTRRVQSTTPRRRTACLPAGWSHHRWRSHVPCRTPKTELEEKRSIRIFKYSDTILALHCGARKRENCREKNYPFQTKPVQASDSKCTSWP